MQFLERKCHGIFNISREQVMCDAKWAGYFMQWNISVRMDGVSCSYFTKLHMVVNSTFQLTAIY
jgi:hypothetical protein